MPRLIDDIRRKLSRIFLGRIIIRELSAMHSASLEIGTHRRGIAVMPMRAEPRVKTALFAEWRNTVAKSAGSLMDYKSFAGLGVSQISIEAVNKPEIKGYRLDFGRRAAARNAIARIIKIPSHRRNRINFLKNPPKIENATLLALYSPIYQEKVLKSALDKSSGNLLFWYDNKRVKVGNRYHLLLLRVFSGQEPLKWVWLPADKKIS